MSYWTDPTAAPQNPTPTVGELGEQLVAEWLQAQNWVILHHRWRCRWGEIDLIACSGARERGKLDAGNVKQNTTMAGISQFTSPCPPVSHSPLLAFIEIKTRSPRNWDADGRLAITLQKQAKLLQAAELFLAKYPEMASYPCRFDVALVSCRRLPQRSSQASVSTVAQGEIQPIPLEEHNSLASQECRSNLAPSPPITDRARQVSSIQLGQPVVRAGYQLVLVDYIPSAFD
ncbi:MAG TPA: YraN family protein [Coleofasciculaceae cyanobacterium]